MDASLAPKFARGHPRWFCIRLLGFVSLSANLRKPELPSLRGLGRAGARGASVGAKDLSPSGASKAP